MFTLIKNIQLTYRPREGYKRIIKILKQESKRSLKLTRTRITDLYC